MNKIKYILAFALAGLFFSCEEYDATVNPPSAVGFYSDSDTFKIPEATPVYDLVVNATTTSDVDRTYSVVFNPDKSTAVIDPSGADGAAIDSYSQTITIPAGELQGHGQVLFNIENIILGAEPQTAVFDLTTPFADNSFEIRSNVQTTITFSLLCPFGEASLNFVFDDYPEETYWELYDVDFNLVSEGGTNQAYANLTEVSEDLCLPAGTYYLLIYDAYGDGFCCAYGEGSFNLIVNGVSVVSGAGDFTDYGLYEFTIQ